MIFEGLIEALEVFTGIIIHADSKAEDKIRCKFYYQIFKLNVVLFDLFDFNEI